MAAEPGILCTSSHRVINQAYEQSRLVSVLEETEAHRIEMTCSQSLSWDLIEYVLEQYFFPLTISKFLEVRACFDSFLFIASQCLEKNQDLIIESCCEKVGLKLNIQKMKIMASGPITSWQIDRETVETVSDFILGGSKITADGDCSHEIKRHLLLGRKL